MASHHPQGSPQGPPKSPGSSISELLAFNSIQQSSSGCHIELEPYHLKGHESAVNVGRREPTVDPRQCLDTSSPQVKLDIMRMIVQYLHQEKFLASAVVVQDEAGLKQAEEQSRRMHAKRLRKAILQGAWEDAISLVSKSVSRQHQKRCLYLLHRQEYLELIDRQEYLKALTYLNRWLKPLESASVASAEEFQSLCYLLTCKGVTDLPLFRSWEGVSTGRDEAAAVISLLIESEIGKTPINSARPSSGQTEAVPANRLVTLMQQAAAYQVEFSPYRHLSQIAPTVDTLLKDYRCIVVPDTERETFQGSTSPCKAVVWLGEDGQYLASADDSIHVFDSQPVTSQQPDTFLLQSGVPPVMSFSKGFGRIWDICCNREGSMLVSAGGDGYKGSVCVWGIPRVLQPNSNVVSRPDPVARLAGHTSDVYACQFHPDNGHIITGGLDRSVRVHDLGTGAEIKSFLGHEAGVLTVSCNSYGNLLVSGGRDSTVRFWDGMSGVCVNTFSQPMGAVTSVSLSSNGLYLLSSSRHGPVRIWDMRMEKILLRCKGHQNTGSSFLRASWGSEEASVMSGSEDGCLYIWDRETGGLLQRLQGHDARTAVYRGEWNEAQSMVATCAQDGLIKTWNLASDARPESQPQFALDEFNKEARGDEARCTEGNVKGREDNTG